MDNQVFPCSAHSEKSDEQKTELLQIKTKLPLVYKKDNGTIEVLPYLDTERKNDIWGIQSGGWLWQKTAIRVARGLSPVIWPMRRPSITSNVLCANIWIYGMPFKKNLTLMIP